MCLKGQRRITRVVMRCCPVLRSFCGAGFRCAPARLGASLSRVAKRPMLSDNRNESDLEQLARRLHFRSFRDRCGRGCAVMLRATKTVTNSEQVARCLPFRRHRDICDTVGVIECATRVVDLEQKEYTHLKYMPITGITKIIGLSPLMLLSF